ncbi:thioesterase II family protein [Streptomyces sp. NPDC059818]|uniref:thioesterase II family protein n=1 Tax=Streptomyces sp. NPDC059818 TaxID=3346962 RepID=UPI00365A3663
MPHPHTPAARATGPVGTRWLACRDSKPGATVELYCFAHAGGSVGEFLRWSGDLPGVRVLGVKMPGRAPREKEPPFTRMADLVATLVDQVDFGPGPFAFFGHSLGGLVAHEVARALRTAGRPQPTRLFVSSVQPPPIVSRRPVHGLPQAELLSEIEHRWGALPAAVHEDDELRDIVLGYFRADMEIAETYAFVPEPPLAVPVTAFVGDQEDSDLTGWRGRTCQAFEHRTLRGGHFYFRDPEQRRELLRHVHRALGTEH